MSQQINLYGKKVNGKLKINNKEALDQWIKNLDEGDEIVVKFNQQKDYKTNRQLRLCYSCFRSIMDKTGYTLEEVKFLVKRNQGICAYHTIEGDEILFCKSISDFTKEELSNFIIRMDMWSREKLDNPLLTNEDKSFLKDI